MRSGTVPGLVRVVGVVVVAGVPALAVGLVALTDAGAEGGWRHLSAQRTAHRAHSRSSGPE